MTKPLRIFVSTLSVEPRYYASCSYKERENNVVVITGKKWDVTDQIEAIVRERLDAIRAAENFGHLYESRYSPATCVGCDMKTVSGDPDPKHVSTSFVERQNLTMRMSMRRFTRLTNAFSKKLENHGHMVALHFMHYNFARIHKTLRITPAMAAGISDCVWSLEEIAMLVDAAYVPKKRGPYWKTSTWRSPASWTCLTFQPERLATRREQIQNRRPFSEWKRRKK